MEYNKNKIKSFTDLQVWQEAHKMVLAIYKITKKFPKQEIFGLVSQICRASVSVTSNIAEGFSRRSYKEKLRFYYISLGSLTEIQNQLLIAKDLNYINQSEFGKIAEQTIDVHKLLNAFITKTRSFI